MSECPIDFVTNDFLGFSRSATLVNEIERRYRLYCDEFPQAQLGARGSRAIVGPSLILQNLEKKIVDFHNAEAACIVHSGYMANLGFCYHVSKDTDMVFWDESVHVSVVQSLKMISGKQQAFQHNDLNALESLLVSHRAVSSGRIFIFVCSIYSFSGTLAPLEELIILSKKYGAHLIVDEAHAMGVFGEEGRGLCYEWGYENFYSVLVTYSKAMGAMGAAILSSSEVKTELMLNSPPLRYTTALAPHALITIDAAYDHLLLEGKHFRKQIFSLKAYFQKHFGLHSQCCGQPIFLRDFNKDLLISMLDEVNLRVGLMTFVNKPFIRVNFHAYNTQDEVDILIAMLYSYLEKCCCGIDIDHELHFG
ncbi:8-amino-7-oxononanoate synthase,8-amino-7-oxononanoate synthase,7-keto-8-aminopelargonate synthetase and related enzymes,8-amino-7-oxononanoate synthase,Aminotransferase class I and II [Chlamydia poikilotherma]|uniref:8-amino-7-oxononanoate synthase,8-amino-7-oxononanoate synthase,7-keto-8-aminopelargonate synthetase and related enzymes,8-amino-7-oxononanoate synthase,Aminotransferase class I and II n=1 Tax=Chlamydia poikilotherma TaxID=1967783 RepID=A0A3B0QI15_9CHLA|nr:aminotransferase class I/II-fold pyridoxal phosphate-dependent enzyme [Chlamydia poikilotherma]SYX09304.1 8-amino-7-oxononanoate synthase,8-amino-7-oxononanoate synthase,7-keto-8-aminopelargonate synthetase and related enzymes,8-amino-7-oxononanoate synthase,Aminotransferase class I and II [Chlamydia poikilotherma]